MFAGSNNCSGCLFEDGRQASCSSFWQPFLRRKFPLYAGFNVRHHLSSLLILAPEFVEGSLDSYLGSLDPFLASNVFATRYILSSSIDCRGNRSYKPNPRLARVLDILFILHAEHEMNCSTAAARHLASRYLSHWLEIH